MENKKKKKKKRLLREESEPTHGKNLTAARGTEAVNKHIQL